ncbi:MAG: thiamine pyrophosphate-dependent enzyme [Elusimicrobiota bacterium]|jgi:hypothetical protein
MDRSPLFQVPVRRSLAESAEASADQFRGPEPDNAPGPLLESLRRALAGLGAASKDVLAAAGPGGPSGLARALAVYGAEAPAGLALPLALGAKYADPGLTVIVVVGREEAESSFGALADAGRANADIVVIVLDEGGSQPERRAVDLADLGRAAGATFTGRLLSSDAEGASEVLLCALQHRGFSFVEVLSPRPGGSGPDDGDVKAQAPRLGVLHEDGQALSWEESDPVYLRRGPAMAETLGLSPKEIAALEASLG